MEIRNIVETNHTTSLLKMDGMFQESQRSKKTCCHLEFSEKHQLELVEKNPNKSAIIDICYVTIACLQRMKNPVIGFDSTPTVITCREVRLSQKRWLPWV